MRSIVAIVPAYIFVCAHIQQARMLSYKWLKMHLSMGMRNNRANCKINTFKKNIC